MIGNVTAALLDAANGAVAEAESVATLAAARRSRDRMLAALLSDGSRRADMIDNAERYGIATGGTLAVSPDGQPLDVVLPSGEALAMVRAARDYRDVGTADIMRHAPGQAATAAVAARHAGIRSVGRFRNQAALVLSVDSRGTATMLPADAARRAAGSVAKYPMGGSLRSMAADSVSTVWDVPTSVVAAAYADGGTEAAWVAATEAASWVREQQTAWQPTADDYADLLRSAWHYCRRLDAQRTSRRRADDVADDVGQDACLALAALAVRAASWDVTATDADDLLPSAWRYVTAAEAAADDVTADDDDDDDDDDDGQPFRSVTRATLARWAVNTAARRHYRASNETATDSADEWRDMIRAAEETAAEATGPGSRKAAYVAIATLRTAGSGVIDVDRAIAVRAALADSGTEVRTYIAHALAADGQRSGRSGALTDAATAAYGGQRGSASIRRRFRAAVVSQAGSVLADAGVLGE